MFCKKAVLVNWGNIPHLEFDFGPVNLFSGGNGSGKTTAADALQALMTAAYENLFTFNPGQDETTQKGRGGKQVRTVASYILGCDDGSYARLRGADGYVAAVFHPTQGESAEPFTAVMCIRASLDTAGAHKQARQDNLVFIVVPGEQLQLAHFVRQDNGGKYVVAIGDIVKLLQKEFGSNAVESYEKKGPYLRRLYGALRGLSGSVSDREAKHAAKTFANFMAYKPVKSINTFVAQEVLDPKDLSEDIRQVSELMKTIHGMEKETRLVKEAIDNLESAQQSAQNYIDNWLGHCVGEYTEIIRRLRNKQKQYLSLKSKQREKKSAIEETDKKLASNKDKKEYLHSRLIELEAERQGISALKDKDQLEKDIVTTQRILSEKAQPLLMQNQQFAENHRNSQLLKTLLSESAIGAELPTFDDKHFRKKLSALLDAGADSGIDAHKLFNSDWVGIRDLESRLDGLVALEKVHRDMATALHTDLATQGDSTLRDQLIALGNNRKDKQQKLLQQVRAKETEVQKLENHAVSYPYYVEQAVATIEEQCPQAKPCVLCDFIDVIEPQWQMAIEGYIGGNRYSIIVEAQYEAEAIRIVRNIKGKRNNARIVQGEKVRRDAAKMTVASDSIFAVMCFEHKVAEYYIKATYGSVLRVQDEKTLRKTARGVMANGLGCGGYSMFRCDIDDADLVFGQGARERALLAKQAQLNSLVDQQQVLAKACRDTEQLQVAIDAIKKIDCAEVVRTMLGVYRQLEKAEQQLKNLDLGEYSDLERALAEAKTDFRAAELLESELDKSWGQLSSELEQLSTAIVKISKEKDALQEQYEAGEQSVLGIAKMYPDFDTEMQLQQADTAAQDDVDPDSFLAQQSQLVVNMDQAERLLHEGIVAHNQNSTAHNSVAYTLDASMRNDVSQFKGVVNIMRQLGNIYNAYKNNILVGKHEKLEALKESFNTAFVTNLCHSIYQSISDGKRILDDLNKELEYHRFGTDQERFYFDYKWVPEFHEYQRFFKTVINIPNLGDGSTLFDVELDSKACLVRDKLLSMLLDTDEQTAHRELNRISDYRNYREYEIYKEPQGKEPIALSKYGTGSGGQLETPAYIIRSAAITSAFKFNEGKAHCRMVLVDEAFSKMDETRSREVINYLTDTLGLQLIFIMPTSKSGPFMDLISHQVVFSKCPTEKKVGELNTRVLVDRKECNTDKIEALWAQHRKTIRHQASLDFMQEFLQPEVKEVEA